MTHAKRVSRRTALKFVAASTALPLVHIRTGRAAGKVSVAFWDHWVPAGNEVMRTQCAAWGAKNQVEVQADFITSVGEKNRLTIAAEAQAKTGHDIQQLPGWEMQNKADQLVPMDDVMGRLIGKFGPANEASQYLSPRAGTGWRCRPAPARRTRGRAGASRAEGGRRPRRGEDVSGRRQGDAGGGRTGPTTRC